jgi:hypothetical protein
MQITYEKFRPHIKLPARPKYIYKVGFANNLFLPKRHTRRTSGNKYRMTTEEYMTTKERRSDPCKKSSIDEVEVSVKRLNEVWRRF